MVLFCGSSGKLTFGVLLLTWSARVIVGTSRTPLYVGGLFELTNHWWWKHTNFFPEIINFALDGIHNRSDILPQYEIKMVVKDTEGKNGLAGKRLTELVQEGSPKVAIFGPYLSDELTLTGQMSPFFNVIQLSSVATTASTVDRELFPTLVKVNQILNDLNPLRIELMNYFGWTKVGTLFFNDDKSAGEMELFHELLTENNMTLLTSAVITDTSNMKQTISRFKQFDVRIIMASFRSAHAPDVFCEAYHQGLYGNSHVWILSGPLMYPNWLTKASGMSCSKEELITASAGYLTLDYTLLGKTEALTVAGMTAQEVMDHLDQMAAPTPYRVSKYAGWIYDSAWTLALGLNNSIKNLEAQGLSLDTYNYSDVYMNAIMAGILETEFIGVSGPVSFDSRAGRMGMSYVQTNFNDTITDVAVYDPREDNLAWLVGLETLWKGGRIPRDSFIYQRQRVETSRVAFGIIVFINGSTFILTSVLLVFNIVCRNKTNLKMSSPMLNNVILIGCFMIYTVVFVTSLDYRNTFQHTTSSRICMLRAWLMSLGFTSLFGALFSKTYRVYAIFRDTKLNKKIIRDYHLFGIVGGLLVIDCLLLIPWTLAYPLHVEELVKNAKDTENSDVIYSEVHTFCYNAKQTYWFASVYIYKGLLLSFGVFLAWETRNVQIEALNDSKYIGACIYNVVIVCVIGVPLVHVLPVEQKTLSYVLEACLIMFSVAICQCILFIPKIQKINQVHGKFIMASTQQSYEKSNTGPTPVPPKTSMSDCVSRECTTCSKKVFEVKEENDQLRMKVAEETISVAKLRKALLEETGNIHFFRSGSEYVVFKAEGSSQTLSSDQK